MAENGNNTCRIVLTGGPGGGKTTAADLFRREAGESVILVPEAATMMFMGGFPRCEEPHAKQAAQRAIYHVQRNLEDVQRAQYPGRVLLCDRGTIDGAAYWPEGEDAFFESMGSTMEAEMRRYDAVIFFESAAVGGIGIETGNPARKETLAEAAALDARLRGIWKRHPRFELIPHQTSFLAKIAHGFKVLQQIIEEHDCPGK